METVPRSWQVPSANAAEQYKIGWLDEQVQQGQEWQKAQRGYKDWKQALDIISGDESVKKLIDYRSHLSGRRLKTNIRVQVAGLSNIKPIWGWHAAQTYAEPARMLNKSGRALYLEGYWDQDVKAALVWANATGVGFINPVYRRDAAGHGKGNIELDTYGAPSVCPVQMPEDGDWQNAYAVTLLKNLPIWMAHGIFPQFQDRLKPTESRYWYSAEIRTASERNAQRNKAGWFGRRATDNLEKSYVPTRYTRVNDLAINTTGYTIPMGQPASSWYYEVPSLGRWFRGPDGKGKLADETDARLYPTGRLLISTPDCCMYDGPQFNWCPELDLIPFYVDWWPWEPMGLSPIHDGWPLQDAIDELDRGSMNKARADLDRALAYDFNVTTEKEARKFDPLNPRERIGYDGMQGDKVFTEPVDQSFYEIRQTTLAVRELLVQELDYQAQTRELVELAKARGLSKGALDDLQALIAANGPLVRDMCRSMEKSLAAVGRQVGWLTLQYMDTARLMQYVGIEGMANEVFDYDPESVIPSHMPGEATTEPGTQTVVKSTYTRMQRAKWFASNIRFFLLPHSAHEIPQMAFKLGLMQLKQRGICISDATIMQAWEVPDVRMPEGITEQERWEDEQLKKLEFAQRIKQALEGLGIDPSMLGGIVGGGKQPGTHGGGRPPSAQAAPRLGQKDQGTRTIVKESP